MATERSKEGRRRNIEGKKYEKDVAKFLTRKMGLTKDMQRKRTEVGEFDLIMKKGNKSYAVEAKHWDDKVHCDVVENHHDKIKASKGFINGGIVVSEHGLTEDAEAKAKKLGIVHLKYAGARKKSKRWPFNLGI